MRRRRIHLRVPVVVSVPARNRSRIVWNKFSSEITKLPKLGEMLWRLLVIITIFLLWKKSFVWCITRLNCGPYCTLLSSLVKIRAFDINEFVKQSFIWNTCCYLKRIRSYSVKDIIYHPCPEYLGNCSSLLVGTNPQDHEYWPCRTFICAS